MESEKTTMQELLPFCRELLSQRPSRSLLGIYVLGSALAVLGTVIGLVETVCHPFTGGDELMDAEMTLLLAAEERSRRRALEEEEERRRREEVVEAERDGGGEEEDHVTYVKTHEQQIVRTLTNRQHAS